MGLGNEEYKKVACFIYLTVCGEPRILTVRNRTTLPSFLSGNLELNYLPSLKFFSES